MEKKQLEFWIGPMGSLVPFAVFLIGTIYICIKGAPRVRHGSVYGVDIEHFCEKPLGLQRGNLCGHGGPIGGGTGLCWR
ncbi:MAG: hypothetical protein ACLTC4_16705 [Hungatella hathewayi]